VSGATGRYAKVLRAKGRVAVEVGTACHLWQSHISKSLTLCIDDHGSLVI
jgi:hypothetical protein